MYLKPGQLCTINNHVYRAKKQKAGCKECYFEHAFFVCPGLYDARTKKKKVECVESRIILEKVI